MNMRTSVKSVSDLGAWGSCLAREFSSQPYKVPSRTLLNATRHSSADKPYFMEECFFWDFEVTKVETHSLRFARRSSDPRGNRFATTKKERGPHLLLSQVYLCLCVLCSLPGSPQAGGFSVNAWRGVCICVSCLCIVSWHQANPRTIC